MVANNKNYIEFTKEMAKEYKILAPDMLPMHFELISKVMQSSGYQMEILKNKGSHIAETGLKYVHNDTCYPAILVIGQFIDALNSGKYDVHKVALIYFQTGGGCRASNYIFLLRKALEKAGLGFVPVISFSLNSMEKHSGFKVGIPLLLKLFYSIFYGDLLYSVANQVKPYEVNAGETQKLAEKYTNFLAKDLLKHGSFKNVKANMKKILEDFNKIEVTNEKKVKVGVVGEIYIKFSALGNNNLENFILSEGGEVCVPGLLDFFLYTVYAKMNDFKLYGLGRTRYPFYKLLFNYLVKLQIEFIEIYKVHGRFDPPSPFMHTLSLINNYIDSGVQMGEGWLLPAEMLELHDKGVSNIVCAQPFGCLPNHICGKGMIKPIKDKNPSINIVSIDYDPGATKVNQENRIKLMLSIAKENLK